MPAYACAGGCVRMISVSAIPGGNPVAKNDPENWALDYGRCETCKSHYCDRCMAKLAVPGQCPKDNTKFTMFGVTPEKPAAPAAAPSPGVSAKPWWKFWG